MNKAEFMEMMDWAKEQTMSGSIKRSDAIKVLDTAWINGTSLLDANEAIKQLNDLPSADKPNEVIYGNEHNCVMTIFGECSYAETGCGDCAVVEKVRKALSADRPQGEWIDIEPRLNRRRVNKYKRCSHCGFSWARPFDDNYCPSCGARITVVDE
jgi:rubrerythrin